MTRIAVRLESNHPIATARGFEPWDGKVYAVPEATLSDIRKLGRWLCQQTGIRMDYRPGTSRFIDGVPHFFPRSYTSGVRCIRVVCA